MKIGDRVQVIETRFVGRIAEVEQLTLAERSEGTPIQRFKVAGHWYYRHELKGK